MITFFDKSFKMTLLKRRWWQVDYMMKSYFGRVWKGPDYQMCKEGGGQNSQIQWT